MRKSVRQLNPILQRGLMAVILLALPGPAGLSAEQAFRISSEDMVAIHADEAWEDIKPDIAHFAGHFDMRGNRRERKGQ